MHAPTHTLGRHIPSDRLSSPTLHPFPASSSFLLLHAAVHTRFPLPILLLVTPSSLRYPNSLFFWGHYSEELSLQTRWPLGPCPRLFSLL